MDRGFFEAAGVPIVEGRAFGEHDREDTPTVAIVSQAFVERYFPGRSAVGQRLRRPDKPDVEIVGISRNVAVRFLGEPPRPLLYLASEQTDQSFGTLLGRTRGDAGATTSALLRSAREIAPDLMVLESKTMGQHLQAMLFPSRALATLFAAFRRGWRSCSRRSASTASSASRWRLGRARSASAVARRHRLRGGSAAHAQRPGAGFRGRRHRSRPGVLVSRAAGRLLFQETEADPLVFTVVPVLLLAVTGLATFLPARRALRVSPSSALRNG